MWTETDWPLRDRAIVLNRCPDLRWCLDRRAGRRAFSAKRLPLIERPPVSSREGAGCPRPPRLRRDECAVPTALVVALRVLRPDSRDAFA
jgi:hypothetical protein